VPVAVVQARLKVLLSTSLLLSNGLFVRLLVW
jgi:hypothetical protein